MAVRVEIAVFNVESALLAQHGGADRVELCDNPAEGGTTPSYGVMEIVRQVLGIEIYIMIRPRGGDFVYTDYEYRAMMRDIEMCKQAGLNGVVLGILKTDGRIDQERCRKLIEVARPMSVTCHRAFDFTRDAFEALDDCFAAGFDRILTSGRMPTAAEGAGLIRELVIRAAGKMEIMAGGGINSGNVREIVKQTGVREIHLSARTFRSTPYNNHNQLIRLEERLPNVCGNWVVDEEKIRKILYLLDRESEG